MGKRSNFVRNKHDAYDTPREAVAPLLPHLQRGISFVEPCAGKHQLADHLAELAGLKCLAARDVAPRDPRVLKGDAARIRIHDAAAEAQMIITNPPWTWELLLPILLNLYWQRPTWLLLAADWKHTWQAAPFMPVCARIVSVGRVRWMPGSPHSSKDNSAWHLFVAPQSRPTFYGRGG